MWTWVPKTVAWEEGERRRETYMDEKKETDR
jgi:hypothetical protein